MTIGTRLHRCVPAVAFAVTAAMLPGCSRPEAGPTGSGYAPSTSPSDPCEGAGSVATVTAPFGPRGHQRTAVYLPACYQADRHRRFPAIYLLHGASADQTQWPDVGITAAADRLIAAGRIPPLIIVMPDGGPAIPDSLADDLVDKLVPWADRTYRTREDPSQRAIGGISRGGRVALEAVAAHPRLCAAVGGHSPAVADGYDGLAARLGATRAAIRFDVGRSDSLRTGVQRFAAIARTAGASVEVAVESGGHDRAYWRSQAANYLVFYAWRWATAAAAAPEITAS